MWKAKITVDAAGLEVKRALMKTINVLCLALLSLQDIPTPMHVSIVCMQYGKNKYSQWTWSYMQSRWRWRWCHHWIRVHFFFLTTKIGAGVKFSIALNIRWPSKYFLPFYIFHTHSQKTTWCSGSTNNSSTVSIHAERMLFQVTAFIPACCFFFYLYIDFELYLS